MRQSEFGKLYFQTGPIDASPSFTGAKQERWKNDGIYTLHITQSEVWIGGQLGLIADCACEVMLGDGNVINGFNLDHYDDPNGAHCHHMNNEVYVDPGMEILCNYYAVYYSSHPAGTVPKVDFAVRLWTKKIS